MISIRSIARKAVCAVFLVQLSGCCCCDSGVFEEFSEGFEEGFTEQMEKEAEEVRRQAKEAQRQAEEAQRQGQEARKQMEKAQKAIADAVVKGRFVDDSVSGHKLTATIEFKVRDRPEAIFATIKGKHYGKKFSGEIEGEVNEMSGVFKAVSVQGPDLKLEGVARDGKVQGALTGKIKGRPVGAPFEAKPAQK